MAKISSKLSKTAKHDKTFKAASKIKPKTKLLPAKKVVNKAKLAKGKSAQKKVKPTIKKAIIKKPITKKTVIKKAIIKKSAAKKTVIKKAVIKKPVIKKAIIKKPVIKKADLKKEIKIKKATQIVRKPVKKSSTIIVKKGTVKVKKEVVVNTKEKKKEEKTIKSEKIVNKTNVEKMEKMEKIGKIGKAEEKGDTAIEKKLRALINLQQIDSQIDKIRIIRGELPLEVQDLEDEIIGIQTRIENYTNEVNALDESVLERKSAIKQCQTLIKKYEAQQMNVRNNREYDSLSKEIEFQNLEIQLCEKRIKEYKVSLDSKKEIIEKSQKLLKEKQNEVNTKKAELTDIIAETEREESLLLQKSLGNQKIIEERLLTAYKKIRKNARNGLAVVIVERDACGGCFNKIPPQRQLDIRIHKKIIVCEYCGRILVDNIIAKS